MIYLCAQCLPTIDHNNGPNDERECASCGRAEIVWEVEIPAIVRALLAAQGLPPPPALTGPASSALFTTLDFGAAPAVNSTAPGPQPPHLPGFPPAGSLGGK